MIEKRVLIAAVLSALFLACYSQLVPRWYGPAARRVSQPAALQNQSPMQASPTTNGLVSLLQPTAKEDVITIESSELQLEIGTSSGAIRRATLKSFKSSADDSLLTFGDQLPPLSVNIRNVYLSWKIINVTQSSAIFNVTDSLNNNYHISYVLDSSSPIVQIEISSIDPVHTDAEIRFISSWTRGDKLNGRNNALESILLTDLGQGKSKYEKHISPWKNEKSVPRGTLFASLSERYFCSSLRPNSGTMSVLLVPSPDGTAAFIAKATASPDQNGRISYIISLYLGPRDYFYLSRAKFSQAIPVGAIGQIGLIFLMFLNWIAKLTGNYGIAIILFSCLVSCITAPFTIMSLKSMKKMQQLKPQIDRIMAVNKENKTSQNKEVFALYKEHRINPLSGCLPMLLQMPIFISLFRAISHFIELRGKSFLWIADLSLPDRIAKLPILLPVLGRDLNVLPIIMAVAMYFQTKISQGNMTVDKTNPSATMMSGPTMSILFGFMFYQFPSGLVLYWLTNSLMSMLWYRLVK